MHWSYILLALTLWFCLSLSVLKEVSFDDVFTRGPHYLNVLMLAVETNAIKQIVLTTCDFRGIRELRKIPENPLDWGSVFHNKRNKIFQWYYDHQNAVHFLQMYK